jgi:ArsR family metal-binding transcriptional regulator
MLIDSYDLEVFSPPCEPGSERWSAFAHLRRDITDVLPYLNAVWRGAVYDHQAHILTLVRGGRRYTLRPFEIAASNLEDRDHARDIVDRIVAEINGVWERRATITPSTEARQRPTVMEVYKLLPGGNCKQCGEATCFIFATKLVAAQTDLDRCTRLLEPGFASQRSTLRQAMGLAAGEVPPDS